MLLALSTGPIIEAPERPLIHVPRTTKKPSVVIVAGCGWGDEGKGKVVDIELERGNFDISARGNGGSNAGHTLWLGDKKIVLHALPSGAAHKHCTLYIGSGCVVNPIKLIEEIRQLADQGVSVEDRLHISAIATTVTPLHVFEDKLTGSFIGTTRNGIGQAYVSTAQRQDVDGITNMRVHEVAENPQKIKAILLARMATMLKRMTEGDLVSAFEYYRTTEPGLSELSAPAAKAKIEKELCDQIDNYIAAIQTIKHAGWIQKNTGWMNQQLLAGKRVLCEGAQALGIDARYGVPPYVTSSSTTPAALCAGIDASPEFWEKTIGVVKAITTRVGAGPLVTELGGEQSEEYCAQRFVVESNDLPQFTIEELLASDDPFEIGVGVRRREREYGATTKRPRRVGLFDIFNLAAQCLTHQITELVITKIDSLRIFDDIRKWEGHIPLATGYQLNGQDLNHIPTLESELRQTIAQLEFIKGFGVDISSLKDPKDLPKAVTKLLGLIREQTRTNIAAIGVGPEREQLIRLAA